MNVGLKTLILPAGEAAVATAVGCLAEGGLVAFPTETVYGLGADATNPAAVARIYQAKGRPAFNPLIAHVGDLSAARRIARFGADFVARRNCSYYKYLEKWSERQDSNLRPLRPERSALPG